MSTITAGESKRKGVSALGDLIADEGEAAITVGGMGSDDVVHLGHRSVVESGESLTVTIPSEVVRVIQIEAGDNVAVRFDRESDEVRYQAAEQETERLLGEMTAITSGAAVSDAASGGRSVWMSHRARPWRTNPATTTR